jgi:hypothetical protein
MSQRGLCPKITFYTPNERIPRLRNALLIFSSESLEAERNKMLQDEKLAWFLKADQEKIAYMQKYPDYCFTLLSRVKKPIKRKGTAGMKNVVAVS